VTSKPLVWLRGEVKTPPFSARATAEAGYLLRLLQEGERVALPQSRPMPVIEVFEKKTETTPKHVLDAAERRWKQYLRDAEED